MEWDVTKIGRFGFKIGFTFEPNWFTLWRKEDGYEMDIFRMDEDDDPVNTSDMIPFELGDRIITEAVDNGHLTEWDESYNAKARTAGEEPFTWSLDIADLSGDECYFISHGMGVLPSHEWFMAVVEAVRQGDPDFGTTLDIPE